MDRSQWRLVFDEAITRREIDVVMAWSVAQLGRSLQDLIGFLGELRAVGCKLHLHQQGVDTTTPAGRALFQMLGVFSPTRGGLIITTVCERHNFTFTTRRVSSPA